MKISAANNFNCLLAYNSYVSVSIHWSTLSDKERKKARRQIEALVGEAGFKGHVTGLISENAWQTICNEYKGIAPTKATRLAKEHPITYSNIALACITHKGVLTFDEFFKMWTDNLVSTVTTNAENQRLKNFQQTFVLGVDDWKVMYELAGIKLIERPKLRSHAAKRLHGILK